MRETVLLINFTDKRKIKTIKGILAPNKIRVRIIEKKNYSQTIGALAGVHEMDADAADYEGNELDEEMILFAGISDAVLDRILKIMKQKNAGVRYKAVLTSINRYWTVPQLYSNLAEEHAALGK